MKSINPYTGALINSYQAHTTQDMDRILDAAYHAQQSWQEVSITQRTDCLSALADLLEQHKEKAARLITQEMGKTLQESVGEIDKCIWVCNHYAKEGPPLLQDIAIATQYSKSYVMYQPLGLVLGVMPWNFPFWQVFRSLVPIILAGNGYVLKHASNVTGCSLLIESLCVQAGFPEHLVSSLVVSGAFVHPVIQDRRIAAVTLTGSVEAGREVAKTAGVMLKKSVLELGGSDAYIVLDDADIDQAIEHCAKGRFVNNGQSCIAAKRLIVEASIHDQFVEGLHAWIQSKQYGDPMADGIDFGPLAKKQFQEELHQQVQRSVHMGATCLIGGDVPQDSSACFPPTLLVNVGGKQPAYVEEIFGPVAAVIKVNGQEEAIQVANDSVFGLGSAIMSQDVERAKQLASQLHVGGCAINDWLKSDPRLPFGGVKDSGYGRELSWFGLYEFTNAKTVVIS